MQGSQNDKHYRELLEAKLASLKAVDLATTKDRAPVMLDQQSVGRLSRMDAIQQQAMAKAGHQRRHTEMRKTKAAIARLTAGEFGYCTLCGDEIAAERLEQDAAVPTCFDCTRG